MIDDFPLHLFEGPDPAAPVLVVAGRPAARFRLARVPGVDRLVVVVSDDPDRLRRAVRALEPLAGGPVFPLLANPDDPPVRAGSLGLVIVASPGGAPGPADRSRRYRELLRPSGRMVEMIPRPRRRVVKAVPRAGRRTLFVRPATGRQYFVTREWLPRPWPFASLQLGRATVARVALERFVARFGIRPLYDNVALVLHDARESSPVVDLPGIEDPDVYVSAGRLALLLPAEPSEVIVKCPLIEPVARSLAGQTATLERLEAAAGPALARFLPHVREQVTRGGQEYWIEGRIRGKAATRDSWWPGRKRAAYDAAFGFLLRLHQSTAKPARLSPKILDRLLVPVAARVSEPVRRVDATFDVEPLIAAARRVFAGREIPLVQTHGDFWPGNILVSRDGELQGVLDWSDSAERGWPMVDLLHLLATRVKWHAIHFFGNVVTRTLMPGRLKRWQQQLVDAYCRELGVPPGLWRGFVAVYWLERTAQHLSEGYRGYEGWIARNVIRVQPEILRLLQHQVEGSK